MSKVWNPGASRETVRTFVAGWCIRETGAWSEVETLFGAYETYCRLQRLKDLTLGEFNDELERLGFSQERRYGQQVWSGLGLAVMEDVLVRRSGGAHNPGR